MKNEDVLRAHALLHPECELVEIRAVLPNHQLWTGLFHCADRLAASVEQLTRAGAEAVYWTINRISPALAGKATNSMEPAGTEMGITREDFDRITNLFLAIDNRGSRDAVCQLTRDLVSHLAGRGWPKPVIVDSGNGYHLFYPADIDPFCQPCLQRVVDNLADKFDRDGATIDRHSIQPDRLARVPGTFNRKGEPRLARIIEEVIA